MKWINKEYSLIQIIKEVILYIYYCYRIYRLFTCTNLCRGRRNPRQAIGMIGGSLVLSLFESKDIKKFDAVTFKNMIPGLVWACANIAMIYANKLNGVAIGFTLSQMAVVVSTFATLVILKEKKSKKELPYTILGTVVVAIGGIMIGFSK